MCGVPEERCQWVEGAPCAKVQEGTDVGQGCGGENGGRGKLGRFWSGGGRLQTDRREWVGGGEGGKLGRCWREVEGGWSGGQHVGLGLCFSITNLSPVWEALGPDLKHTGFICSFTTSYPTHPTSKGGSEIPQP